MLVAQVSYLEFNNRVATVVHPSRTGALVVKPKQDGVLRRKRREVTTARFAALVEGKVARHAVGEVADAAKVLARYDRDGSGTLSKADFLRALGETRLRLKAAHVAALVDACGVDEYGRVRLVDFSTNLARVMKVAAAKAAIDGLHQRKKPANAPRVRLPYEDALEALQSKLTTRFSSVKKAFRSFDVRGTGQVRHPTPMRAVSSQSCARHRPRPLITVLLLLCSVRSRWSTASSARC